MSNPKVAPGRLALAVLAIVAPAALALMFFVVTGRLAAGWAAAALLVIVAGSGWITYRHSVALELLRRRIDGLAEGERPDRIAIDDHIGARELAAAIDRLERHSSARHEELRSLVVANEAMLDAAPDPLILIDRQRRILRVNIAASDLFGKATAGGSLASLLRIPVLLDAVDVAIDANVGDASAAGVEFMLPGPIERHFSARVVRLPELAAYGGAVLIAFFETTSIRLAERMRADFVANVSHELRTPLATLLGFVETLRGAARDDTQARERFLAIMHEQTGRMSRLVGDLLSLSKIEESEHTPPTGHVDLPAVLRGVADALDPQARARSIRLVLDLPGDVPPVIGDGDQLTQVFQNLVDNAIKYGRRDTIVRIAVRLDRDADAPSPGQNLAAGTRIVGKLARGACIAVDVADSGEGIAREHLTRLSERFYRVDAGRSRELGGTGLGLAIVKHIVNRHRGALAIASVPGHGSAFTVYLPLAEAGSDPSRVSGSSN
jgi:two-component system phosphate regulon sensor histidine kinase PhoR